MDDFPGLLARDFGYKPQGKSVPMASSWNHNLSANSSSSNFGLGSNASEFTKSSSLKSNAVFDDHHRDGLLFNNVFGGPPKYSSTSAVDSRSGGGDITSSFDYDSIFRDQNAKAQNWKTNSMPVYDDDIFEGLPGLKSSSATAATVASQSAKFDDVFSSISESPPKQRSARESSPFDDLLGNLGKKETESRVKSEKDASAFDDLLPGFGRSSSPSSYRSTSESSWSQKRPSSSTETASSAIEDPFVVLESASTPVGSSSQVVTDPLEEIGKFSDSGSAKVNGSSVSGIFDDLDPLTSFGKSVPPVAPEVIKRGKDRSPLRSKSPSGMHTHPGKESIDRSSMENSEGYAQNRTSFDGFRGSNETFFDMRSASTDSHRSVGRATSPPSYMSGSPSENSQINTTPKSEEIFESADDVWLTVSEIPLFTQPTSVPPPSRPPPLRPSGDSKSDTGSVNAGKKNKEYSSSFSNSSQYAHSPKSARAATRSPVASQVDELDDFAMGRSWNNVNEYGEVPSGEDVENSVAAAAMKEAMDRADAKFHYAKEMRERESLKAARSRDSVQLVKDERSMSDSQERELRERQERLDHERLQREKEEEQRRLVREREEKEREQRRLEKEMERAREIEKEREKARQAVERATREARERAAAEARMKAQRAAVDKVNAAARERAERAAVQRAQAEARERAVAEARERAERAAAEARERANAEAREKEVRERSAAARAAEQATMERATAEARERVAAEARERAAAARANQNQQKNYNDLESFFSMNSQPSSAPRPRANSSDPLFDTQRKGPESAARTSVGASSHMKKASSTTNIVDDLSSIFGAAGSSAGEFQDVEGENEERRRARLERHQRTQERAAKALADKNQRDVQAQREQAERHRIAETLDIEIKRWAAGKEGNIRALLATLQYVLWPECGWHPVSLTDLITAAAVKKVYRKATLCIHPDKVQQKGANLQQKYIAEKVFDLLKEAWNKFNSEELF